MQIRELERRYTVSLPEDFKAYLSASSPVDELWDSESTAWWHFDRIRNIPTFIVQGRYDLVCPVRSADDLSRAWPQARYTIIPDAGHSAMEPGTRSALVAGMEAFKSVA